jgi:hypothetical protein
MHIPARHHSNSKSKSITDCEFQNRLLLRELGTHCDTAYLQTSPCLVNKACHLKESLLPGGRHIFALSVLPRIGHLISRTAFNFTLPPVISVLLWYGSTFLLLRSQVDVYEVFSHRFPRLGPFLPRLFPLAHVSHHKTRLVMMYSSDCSGVQLCFLHKFRELPVRNWVQAETNLDLWKWLGKNTRQ